MEDEFPCPNCRRKVVAGSAACPHCALKLTGPVAAELGEVERNLVELYRRRGDLIVELLPVGAVQGARPARRAAVATPTGTTPAGPAPAGTAAAGTGTTGSPPVIGAVIDAAGGPPDGAVPVSSGGVPSSAGASLSGQQVLLALGALLVLAAVGVFLAVNWTVIGPGGQLTVSVVVAGLLGWLSVWSHRRGLRSSGEVFAGLTVLVLAATAAGAQVLGLWAGLDDAALASAAAVVIAGVSVLVGLAAPLTAYRVGTILPAQLVVPAAFVAWDLPVPAALAAVAVAGPLTLVLAGRWEPFTAWAVAVMGGIGVAFAAGGRAWVVDVPGWEVAVAVLAMVGVWAVRSHPLRPVCTAAVGVSVAALLFRDGDPLAAAAVAAAVTAPAVWWRTRTSVPLQVAAVMAAGSVAVAAGVQDAPTAFAVATVALWALVVRNLRTVPVLAGPATAAAAGGVLWAAGAGLPVGAAATACAVAAVAVAALHPAGRAVRPRAWAAVGAVAAGAATGLVALIHLIVEVGDNVGLGGSPSSTSPTPGLLSVAAGAAGVAVTLGWTSWRLPVRWLLAGAAAVASLAVGFVVATFHPEAVEWYTYPAAAIFAVVGIGPLRRWSSFLALGPAAGLALGPTALLALGGADLGRLVLVLVWGPTIAVAAVFWRRAAPLVVAALVLLQTVAGQDALWDQFVPRALALGVAGALLLAAGVRFERSRRLGGAALRFLRTLH